MLSSLTASQSCAQTHLLLLSLCSSSSGDTYWAVPTNVLVGSPRYQLCQKRQMPVGNSDRPPESRSLPVPKSVIFIRKASSSSKFSGLRSLRKREIC